MAVPKQWADDTLGIKSISRCIDTVMVINTHTEVGQMILLDVHVESRMLIGKLPPFNNQ